MNFTMELIDIFSCDFMHRALIAGLLVAVSCAVLGVFMVLRREAMIGHGLAHVTFGGVALALIINANTFSVALVFGLLAAMAIVFLKDRAGLGGDTGIGILSSVGMALGIVLASVAGDFNADLLSYFFGSLLTIGPKEEITAAILALSVLFVLALFFNELVFATFDQESAVVSGVPAGRLDMVLVALSAVTVVIGMKVVGLLLVAALMVIPAATGLVGASSFKVAVIWSILVALISVLGGLLLAVLFDLPAAGSIVLLSGGLLGMKLLWHNFMTR